MKYWREIIMLGSIALLLGCQSKSQRGDPPMELADYVDLPRFMGTWYVQGYSPTFIDKEAHNPTETYEMGEDGKILTTYQFRKGSFEGKEKTYKPVGKVFDEKTNAEWRMTFFSVFTSPYLILYVSEDYEHTVIGHPDRSMAWIMTRKQTINDATYNELKEELTKRNFDLSNFKRAPQESLRSLAQATYYASL